MHIAELCASNSCLQMLYMCKLQISKAVLDCATSYIALYPSSWWVIYCLRMHVIIPC